MKWTILGSITALTAALGIAVALTAQAHADSNHTSTPDQDSVVAKQDHDFYWLLTEPDQDHPMVIWNFPLLRSQGIAACEREDAGETPYQALKDLQFPHGVYTFDEANAITSAAEVVYCPWHGASVSTPEWVNTSDPVYPRPVYPAFKSPTTASTDVGFTAGPGEGPMSPIPRTQCSPGWYVNKSGNCVESPDQNPYGGTARCCDRTESHSQHRSGTCSGHGGVCQWNSLDPGYSDKSDNRSADDRTGPKRTSKTQLVVS
jgi:hypothetical protein